MAKLLAALFVFSFLGTVGCTKLNFAQSSSRAVDAYCPYLPSKTFPSSVVVSGSAIYEYRVNGNGAPSDSGVQMSIAYFSSAAARTYSVTINSRVYSVTSSLSGSAAQREVVTRLKSLIEADPSSGLYAYGISSITFSNPKGVSRPDVTAPINMTVGSLNPDARPIRYAEVAVKNSVGAIVQCAETQEDGSFSFELPQDSGSYTVELRSRSNNSKSHVYVFDTPTSNYQHTVSAEVGSLTSQVDVLLRARVHVDMTAGAFNILDQMLKAQNYLRTETLACDQTASANYFPGCIPFTEAPMVFVYWAPGVSPSTYIGSTSSISYYLNGRRELYIEGGQGGNVTSSDMDQFDNSVIVHEYAHFIEDAFGRPDSPGGSHNADAIVDPRLAWGEGWANFLQAAVLGEPVYRDTYGTPDCTTPCAGTFFNASIDPTGTPPNDAPTPGALGEGNFREFSVTRMLWDVIKPTGGTSRFAEIWRALNANENGMKAVDDPFKTVGRFHAIQSSLSGATSWSSIRALEEQVSGFSVYGTRFQPSVPSCTSSPIAMTPFKDFGDNGSFATSDQYQNNDFFRVDHPGGSLSIELFYSKDISSAPDLDFYLYRPRYVFGRTSDMMMSSAFGGDGCPFSGSPSDSSNPFRAQNGCPAVPSGLSSNFGYEKSSATLAAGTYMLNVQADTTVRAGAATNYVLILNGQVICPQP